MKRRSKAMAMEIVAHWFIGWILFFGILLVAEWWEDK